MFTSKFTGSGKVATVTVFSASLSLFSLQTPLQLVKTEEASWMRDEMSSRN